MSGAWPPPPGEQPPPPPGPQPGPQPGQWPAPGTPVPPQQPPPYAGFGGPGFPGPQPPPPLPPAHKPGAIPLRPLGLGEMLDGAFRLVRFNPGATVGGSVLVAAVAMAIPVLVTAVATFANGGLRYFSTTPTGSTSDSEVVATAIAFGALMLGVVLNAIGSLLVSGMMAHVAHAAAIGRRISLAEAWAATRGSRWRLVGLSLLVMVAGILVFAVLAAPVVVLAVAIDSPVPAILVGLLMVVVWAVVGVLCWVRLVYLAVPALMVERLGVFAAFGRAWRLTRRQFWRTFGIALLAGFLGGIVGQVVGVPVSLIGSVVAAVAPDYGLLATIVAQAVATVLSAAIVTPFTTAVTNLQYLDQRMRKESYEVELMEQAGLLTK